MAVIVLKHAEKYAGTHAERLAMDVSRVSLGSTFFEWDTSELFTFSPTGWVDKIGQVAGSMQLSGSNLAEATTLNVTLAGTRQQLPDIACSQVMIIAKRDNTGYIYVGKNTVSSTVYGAELGELDCVVLPVSNANEIYIDASVSGEGISYVAI